MAHDVFICHSSKDKKIADAICAKLEQSHIRCWIAPRDVVPGSDFAEAIVAAIHATKVTVFVFSKHSNVSPHVKHELERTVSLGLPILPFRVEDVMPSPALEYFISSAHWLDALTPPMEQHIDRLVTTVADLLELEAVHPSRGTEVPLPPSRRRWILAALGAAILVGAVVVGLVFALGRGGSNRGTASTGPTSSATPSATPDMKVAPFVDDFTTGVGTGWSWTNEDATAWRTSPQGWLEIDTQESPPIHNLLLRDAPGRSYNVKVRFRFPPAASGFAGLVLMGEDPDTRLEIGWTKQGLATTEYKDGNIAAGTAMYARDLNVPADRDIQLVLEVADGHYHAKYYDRKYAQYLELSAKAELDPSFTRIGLMAYQTRAGGAGTAAFDRIEFYS